MKSTLYALIYSFVCLKTINMVWFIVFMEGSKIITFKNDCSSFSKIGFSLTYSVDID